jgi:FKBP-type peptidyl-prolyl cis-trans isomerase FkpA
MKQTIFTLLVLTTIGLISCRKDRNDPGIKEYDQSQIQNYIAANSITGMQRDTTDGDTTGIYYKIISQGRGTPMDYSDQISFVFTLRTLDGKFVTVDSLNANHFYGYLGHVSNSLPKGVQIAIHNLLKYKGTAARVIIPSHLGYGVAGFGSGSSSNANTHVGGNQSLDYYINVVSNQEVYDNAIINNYKTRNSLTGYTTLPDGLQYKILLPGTGTDVIGDESAFTATYAGTILDGTSFDTQTTAANFDFSSGTYIAGFLEGLKGLTVGSSISLFIPSRLGYGITGNSTSVPPISSNVVLHFELQVATVTN